MSEPQIQPHRITKPIQLLAVLMAGLVLLVGLFLTEAQFLTKPDWLPVLLAVAAVLFVPMFLLVLFLLQTRFRPQLQEDVYYSEYLAKQQTVFRNFVPENLPDGKASSSTEGLDLPQNPELSGVEDLEQGRVERYKKYEGVFLVHSWRASLRQGQVADVVLELRQHGQGPLSRREVDYVEYTLGPKFFRGPVVKRNFKDCFRLEISAYSPMLCVARVHLQNGSSFDLERYVDFDVAVATKRVLGHTAGRLVDGPWGSGAWGSPPVMLDTD